MRQLREILPGAVADLIRSTPMSAGKIEFAWRVVVGPALERVTSVRRLDDGALEVAATDPRWAREIERSAQLIIARLRELLGEDAVKKLKVHTRSAAL